MHNTLDLSGWSTPSIINLEPGSFSSGNGFTNNIGIAFNTVIEKAIGGGGNDTINGNAYDNILVGGPGNDLITGGPGADRFVLGAPSQGVDTYFDFAYYQGDRIALDHVGFGLSGTGGLAAAGVNFVYAFAPPSFGYNGPPPPARPSSNTAATYIGMRTAPARVPLRCSRMSSARGRPLLLSPAVLPTT